MGLQVTDAGSVEIETVGEVLLATEGEVLEGLRRLFRFLVGRHHDDLAVARRRQRQR